MSFMTSYVALWFLAGFLTLVSLGLLREVTVLRRSLEGFQRESPLVLGSRAPQFSAVDIRSDRKVTSEFLHGRTTLILFISPQCTICRHLVHSLQSLLGKYSFSAIAVCRGDESDCRDVIQSLSSEALVLLDAEAEISEVYSVSNYPVAVIIDAERRVRGYGYPTDSKSLEDIVKIALRGPDTTSQLASEYVPGKI